MSRDKGDSLPIILVLVIATVLIIIIGTTGVKTDEGDGSIGLIATIAFFAILLAYLFGKDSHESH